MNDTSVTPGLRLRAEREQRGLSAQKVADEMHLDAWVIDALEAGDYARIGPTVYAKGHLRKYATMLDLPVGEIMSDFEPLRPAAPSRAASNIPVGSRHGTRQQRVVSTGQAAASLAAVILLMGVMWWQPWHHRERSPAIGAPPAASAVAQPPGPVVEDAPSAPATGQDEALHTPAVTGTGGGATGGAPTPARTAPVTVASTPGAGRARLRLSFTSDSWVDVRDALGNRTYAGIGSANTVKNIAGNAPLRVYLRSGNGVQLEINGRAVAIGSQFFTGDAARFEAGADGVLRRDAARPDAARPDGARPDQTSAPPPG